MKHHRFVCSGSAKCGQLPNARVPFRVTAAIGTVATASAVGRLAAGLVRFTLVGVLSLLGGCTTVNEYFVGTDTAEPPAELKEVQATIEVQEVWSKRVGDGVSEQYLKLRPAIANGRLYAADRDGEVSAYDASTGELLWSTKTGFPISGGPGVGPGVALIGTSDGEVIALDSSSGEQRWLAQVSSEVLAPPVSGETVVVARTGDGKLYGLDLATGERRWVYDRSVPALSLRGTSTPAVHDGQLVAGFDSGYLVSIELETGLTMWERQIAVPRGRSELERLVDIDADPIIADNTIYAVSFQGRLAALDMRSGEFIWRRDMSSHTGLSLDDTNIYVSDEHSHVWALDRDNSGSLWRQQELQARALTAPAAVDNYVVTADFEGHVHWMAKDDGHLVARTQVGDGVIAPPLVYQGKVFIYDRGGRITVYTVN